MILSAWADVVNQSAHLKKTQRISESQNWKPNTYPTNEYPNSWIFGSSPCSDTCAFPTMIAQNVCCEKGLQKIITNISAALCFSLNCKRSLGNLPELFVYCSCFLPHWTLLEISRNKPEWSFRQSMIISYLTAVWTWAVWNLLCQTVRLSQQSLVTAS